MTCLLRRMLAIAAGAVLALAPSVARAQTAAPTVSPNTAVPYPNRYLNYGTPNQIPPPNANPTESTRPPGLTPLGVNYDDCVSDMTLVYSVYLSGFTGQSIQVWASESSDCTTDGPRGVTGVPSCTLLYTAVINQVQALAYTFPVRVQDLIGVQQGPSISYQRKGPSACSSQPNETAVQMTVYFVPIQGNTMPSGASSFQQTISTDVVGPSPPIGVSIADGDTLQVINWTPNSDADTAGYDIFMDPIPGSGQTEASAPVGTSTTVLVCPDSGATSIADASDDAADASDAASDAAASTGSGPSPADAGCYTKTIGPATPAPGATTCGSSVLQSQSVIDAGQTITTPAVYDDAGNLIQAGTTSSGNVGISTIPCDYLVGASCPAGQPAYLATALTLTGESNGTFTVKGLINNVTYNVVVAAVDNSGNVGPPSAEQCDYPAPVDDFWKMYRSAGGQAGGGFCALEAVGMPAGSAMLFGGLGAGLLAALRRRRRGRR